MSAHDLNDPRFADRVAEMLATRGLSGSALVVELTETALLADPDAASAVLWRLAEHGVRIAIDDFGAGYASLLYLRRFPVSVLKLDRSLVQGLTIDTTDAALVRWTIEMAHTLQVTCVAEGVEDVETLEALQGAGLRPGAGLLPAGAGAGRRAGALPDLGPALAAAPYPSAASIVAAAAVMVSPR